MATTGRFLGENDADIVAQLQRPRRDGSAQHHCSERALMSNLPARQNREPQPELGPHMRALHPRWQRAVLGLFLTNGNRSKALQLAGYNASSGRSLANMASRLFSDERIRLAIQEECRKRIDTSEPELIATTLAIMRNGGEKAADRLRAADMMWSRANPVQTKHAITVEHHLNSDERDIQHYRALKSLGAPLDAFVARFGPNGLPRVEAMVIAEEQKRREIEGGTTIEATFDEVDEEQPAAAVAQAPDEPEPEPADEMFDEELLS